MQPSFKMEPIWLTYKGAFIACDRWSTSGQLGEVLLLHGGGRSSKEGFNTFRKTLLHLGYGSLSLDFIGHGETGGSLIGYSLQDRLNQVVLLLESVHDDPRSKPLSIIGFSMGAYIATLLTNKFNVERLGLMIPAMYSPLAFDIPFGPGFSKVIRAERSWCHSDGFDVIRNFKGSLLVVSAEKDEVIPREVPDKLFSEARSVKWKHHHIIPDGTHDLSGLTKHSPEKRYSLLQSIFYFFVTNDQKFIKDIA